MQTILPSLHLLEVFMPVVSNEDFFIQHILQDVSKINFYKGIEMPVIFDRKNQKTLRETVSARNYQLTVWASPNLNEKGYNLSSLDPKLRKESVAFAKEMLAISAEMGGYHIGLPSGPDVEPDRREEAKKALFDSFCQIGMEAAKYSGLHLTFEPLDRYAHKKQLMGPIHEVIDWFRELKKECPAFYIHWDSAHEALAGINLTESLEAALPFLAQLHLCNCIIDPSHPCYGDHHMELGAPPEYINEGYLLPGISAEILQRVAAQDPVPGIRHTHIAVEVRTHMGNDMWKLEREIREYLMYVFELAGIPYDK
ncbi:MAG: TIM barrel protein [Lachnospiraceae bacterium]|nr:TIM barrel protein [Lachnospiraceae bacterium]